MKNLFSFKSLKAAILSGFVLLIALVAAFAVYSFIVNNSMEKKADELINHQLKMLTANQKLATSVTVRAAATTNFITTGDDKYLDIFNTYSETADEQIQYLNKIDPDGAKKRQGYADQGTQWREDIEEKVFTPQIAGDTDTAINNLKALNDQATVVRTGYDELVSENEGNISTLGNEVINASRSSKIVGVIIGIAILIAGLAIAIFTANAISKPIRSITNRLEILASGDLSQPTLTPNRQDEIGTLTKSANMLSEKMNEVISAIHHVSENVASHSEELAQSANEVKQGSEQIATTMHDIAEGTDTQSNRTSTLAEIVDVFKASVQEATEEGRSLSNLSGNVHQLTASGQNAMLETTNQMNTINDLVYSSVEKVESLNMKSKEITNLVSVISDIANQTNLLALNAAIEAARAGEHGKGFAVVADEVRKLAEQVKYSVEDISKIVESIQSETTSVTSSLHSGYEEVKKGTSQMQSTNATFVEISNAVQSMNNNIELISGNLSKLEKQTATINDSVNEIAVVTEQASAGIQQTSATVQETTSSMEEMANSSDQLAQMAESLNDEVQKFKLS